MLSLLFPSLFMAGLTAAVSFPVVTTAMKRLSLCSKRFRGVFCSKAEGRVFRFLAAQRLGQDKNIRGRGRDPLLPPPNFFALAPRFAQNTLQERLLSRL